MNGRIIGVVAAASLALASVASANPIQLSRITPPGAGNPGSTALLRPAPLAVFGGAPATSGSANNLPAGPGTDFATLVAAVNPAAGQVYVFAVATGNILQPTALVVMTGGALQTTLSNTYGGTGVFQTGGVNVNPSGSGYSGFGSILAPNGTGIFAFVGMPYLTDGGMAFSGGGAGGVPLNAFVNFLTWDGTALVEHSDAQMSGGSLNFVFQVVPVPAPAALAGLGLIGAGLLRRRMSKH